MEKSVTGRRPSIHSESFGLPETDAVQSIDLPIWVADLRWMRALEEQHDSPCSVVYITIWPLEGGNAIITCHNQFFKHSIPSHRIGRDLSNRRESLVRGAPKAAIANNIW